MHAPLGTLQEELPVLVGDQAAAEVWYIISQRERIAGHRKWRAGLERGRHEGRLESLHQQVQAVLITVLSSGWDILRGTFVQKPRDPR